MLPPGEIHVWLAFDREVTDERLLRAWASLLLPEERERAQRLRPEHLPQQYIVTRALQRSVLSLYAPTVAPQEWRFATLEHGKPALAAPFAALGLHFNIAHTASLVAMAISHEAMLGIDVESCMRRPPTPELAARYFDESEACALAALAPEAQMRRFLALWTLKESWLKATGAGLGGGLDKVCFEFGRDDFATAATIAGDDAARWRFWQAFPSDEHLLALALRTDRDTAYRARLLRWPPAPGGGVELATLRALGRAAF